MPDYAGDEEREQVRTLCADVLDGIAHLSDVWERWPAAANHAFYKQCYEDVNAYLEYEYIPGASTSAVVPGVIPVSASAEDRWFVELDFCLLESQSSLEALLRCRQKLAAEKSFCGRSALAKRAHSCLQSQP